MSSQLDVDIYNEISFQHELGIFIRQRLYGTAAKVFFEKNIYEMLGMEKAVWKEQHKGNAFIKSEIDIVVKCEDELYAVELKYPRNGMHPEEMFEFLKDICFMEELKNTGKFTGTYALTLVDDRLFYEGAAQEYPYSTFRKPEISIDAPFPLSKPTGEKKGMLISTISGIYSAKWKEPAATWACSHDDLRYKYYLFEI